MQPVTVRNMKIGEGIPKICAPIVGVTKEEILAAAGELAAAPVDLAEWRADWFSGGDDANQVLSVLPAFREALGEKPLLFTFRTACEGGEKDIGLREYAELLAAVCASGQVDLVDVELFRGKEALGPLIETAHRFGVPVVASNHDFEKTPEKEEILRRLCTMQSLGADILKIAVMPEKPEDVLTLLAATEEARGRGVHCPVITMSMGGTGVVSRLCGEVFGSAVTFGAVGKSSAPGQIPAEELSRILHMLHKCR